MGIDPKIPFTPSLRALKLELQQHLNSLDEREKAVERHTRNIEGTIQQNIVSFQEGCICPVGFNSISL